MEEGVPVSELEKRKVDSKLVELIVHAMEPRKKDRIPSAEAFLKSLEAQPVKTQRTSKEEKTIVIGTTDEATVVVGTHPLPSSAEETKKITVNGVSFNMKKVEAGTFTMGATPEMQNPSNDEKPAHLVTLTNDYYIGETVVTQALWKAVMGKQKVKPSFLRGLLGATPTYRANNPSHFLGNKKPVENVSWNDCQTFISKLNAETGLKFRLPTEAEWEFAARGGNKSRRCQYSGGNNASDVAWHSKNSKAQTHDVMTKEPNELGLYDMSGNVWEWCNDWYDAYKTNSKSNPKGCANGSRRVRRGGSLDTEVRKCRSSYRSSSEPDAAFIDLGFRLALSLDK